MFQNDIGSDWQARFLNLKASFSFTASQKHIQIKDKEKVRNKRFNYITNKQSNEHHDPRHIKYRNSVDLLGG